MTDNQYPRDILESGLDARIASIVEPEIEGLGFRLVRVQVSGLNGTTLQIMVERPDGMINVDECETVSRALSPLLDIEEPIKANYHLEISSPGIDRPLVRVSDFADWSGHIAKLETKQMVQGRKRFKGTIVSVSDREITFRRDQVHEGEDENFSLIVDDMAQAKLVLTDELIDEALRRDKALREANGIVDGPEEEFEQPGQDH